MKSISLNITKAASFLAEGAVKDYEPKVKAAQEALENGTCEGNDFLGWLHLPLTVNQNEDGTTINRLNSEELAHWLEDYTLGDLWKQNIMKGGQSGVRVQ